MHIYIYNRLHLKCAYTNFLHPHRERERFTYACMHVCTLVSLRAGKYSSYVYVCVCACVCVMNKYTYNVCVYIYTYVYIYMRVCVRMCVINKHTYHVCVYINIYIYIIDVISYSFIFVFHLHAYT